MKRKIAALAITAAVLGTGATVYAQSADRSSPVPSAASLTEIPEPPTVLEDWCGFMGAAIGPGLDAPSVRSAYATALQSGIPSPATAYVALLDGIPPEVEPHLAPLRAAEDQLEAGTAAGDPAGALAAAERVDAFRTANCAAP